jgi:hypothetical protein
MASIILATGSVEKAALGQDGGADLGNGSAQHQRHRQGSLADALTQGEVTQQVQELRWRMYKVLEQSQKYKTTVIGYDEDGYMLTEQTKIEDGGLGKGTLAKVKMDDTDYSETDEAIAANYQYYPLELIVNNDSITQSVVESNPDEKPEKVLSCVREGVVKFDIEDYSKKMNIRSISPTEKLLEFYVSIYPDEYNRRSRFFISEIKKTIKNPRMGDFLDISNIMFVSYNTVGVKDLMEFDYKVTKFDKIVEYGGYYVIKFKAEVVKNGESIVEKFRDEDLDERYENKEKKDV